MRYTAAITAAALLAPFGACAPDRATSPSFATQAGPTAAAGRPDTTGLRPCGRAMNFFTHLPVPLSGIRGIAPLGSLNPPSGHILPKGHIHFYVPVADPAHPIDNPIEQPLVSPGRLTLAAVEARPDGQYVLYFKPCDDVTLTFDHVSTLTPELLAKIGRFAAGFCSGGDCVLRTDIALRPGEPIGSVGRSALAFDLRLLDKRRDTLPFANPVRYELTPELLAGFPPELQALAPLIAPQRLQQYCPLDYFIPPLRASLYALLGSFDGTVRRTAEPRCGVHMQDELGTAQGNWFLGANDNAFFEDHSIGLVHNEVDPSIPVFSNGSAVPGWAPDERFYTANATGLVNRDFGDVVPGSVYCYENLHTRGLPVSGTVLLEVFSSGAAPADRLRIELRPDAACGAGPWTFSDAAIEFQR